MYDHKEAPNFVIQAEETRRSMPYLIEHMKFQWKGKRVFQVGDEYIVEELDADQNKNPSI